MKMLILLVFTVVCFVVGFVHYKRKVYLRNREGLDPEEVEIANLFSTRFLWEYCFVKPARLAYKNYITQFVCILLGFLLGVLVGITFFK